MSLLVVHAISVCCCYGLKQLDSASNCIYELPNRIDPWMCCPTIINTMSSDIAQSLLQCESRKQPLVDSTVIWLVNECFGRYSLLISWYSQYMIYSVQTVIGTRPRSDDGYHAVCARERRVIYDATHHVGGTLVSPPLSSCTVPLNTLETARPVSKRFTNSWRDLGRNEYPSYYTLGSDIIQSLCKNRST